jgi:DNA replication and repair protein RecF
MIRTLSVKGLRNLNINEVKLSAGFNIIIGENGQGKTNLLEALYFLAYGKSFRDDKSKVINWDTEEASIRGKTHDSVIEIIVKRESETKIYINGKPKKLASLLGRFLCVVFHPQEIELISGAPSLRRSWIDRLISTIDKKYLYNLVKYQRSLQNKNRLLKMNAQEDQIDVWDKNLSKLGTEIWTDRAKTIDQVNHILKLESKKLTGRLVFIEYKNPLPKVDKKEAANYYFKQLASRRAHDRRLLATTFGPHRDDLRIIFEQRQEKNIIQKEISSFGSRAEQRQSVLLLKLAEANLFSSSFGEGPTLLLDDIASELDTKNRQLLTRLYAKQVIITATNLNLLPKSIVEKGNIFKMEDGRL